MRTPEGVPAFIARLEDRIENLVSGQKRVVLAYSGGLSSTLLAMVARKRCDLVCVVAGVEGSPDLRAAKAAKDHLDYRVEYVYLNRTETRRIHENMRSSSPSSLSSVAVRALIPVRAVREARPRELLVAGIRSPRPDEKLRAMLREWKVECPLVLPSRGLSVPRSMLRGATVSLGLPVEWAHVAHRDPATGAGIDRFLQRPTRTRR